VAAPAWTFPRVRVWRDGHRHASPRAAGEAPAARDGRRGQLGDSEWALGVASWPVRPRAAARRVPVCCATHAGGAGGRQAEAIATGSSLSWAAQVGMVAGLAAPCTARRLELLGCAIVAERALHRTVLDQAGLERGWAADVAEAFRPKLKRVRQASRLATVLGCAQALRARVEAECGDRGAPVSCNDVALHALLRTAEPALERRIEGAVGGGLAQGLAGLMQKVHLGGQGESWHTTTARVLVNEARSLADEARVTNAVDSLWNRAAAATEEHPELTPGMASVSAIWELILFCYEGEEALEADEQGGAGSDDLSEDLCEIGIGEVSSYSDIPQYTTGEGGRRVWGKGSPSESNPEVAKSAAVSQYALAQELTGFAGALLDGLLVRLVEKLLVEQKRGGGEGEDLDRAEAMALATMVTMCNRCGCEAIFLRHFGSTRLAPLAHPALWGALAGRRVAAGLQRELEGFTRKDREPGNVDGIPTPGALVVFGLYEYLGQCAAGSAAAHPEGAGISQLVDHCSGGYVLENPFIWRVNQYAAFVDLVRGELAWWSRPLQDESVLSATSSSIYGAPSSARPDVSLRDAQELGAQLLQGPPSPASVVAGIAAYTRVCLSSLGERDIPHVASYIKEVERLLRKGSDLLSTREGTTSLPAGSHAKVVAPQFAAGSAVSREDSSVNREERIPEAAARVERPYGATDERRAGAAAPFVSSEDGKKSRGAKKVRPRPTWVSANVDGLKQKIRDRKKLLSSGEAVYSKSARSGNKSKTLSKTELKDSLSAFDVQLEALDLEMAKIKGDGPRIQRLMVLRKEALRLREDLEVKGQRRIDAMHRRAEVLAVGRDIEKLEQRLKLVNASSELQQLCGKGAAKDVAQGLNDSARGQTMPELEDQIEGAKAVWKQLHELESKVEGEEDSLRFAKGLDDMNELIGNVRTTVSTIGKLQDHIHQIERHRPLTTAELRDVSPEGPKQVPEAELMDESSMEWLHLDGVRGGVHEQEKGLLATTIQTLKDGGEWFSTASQLLGHDVRESVSLLQWSRKGGRLTPRERRVLWRTAGDLLTAVPVATIMVLPLTPVGHALALGFLQKRAPGMLPTAFGDPERVAQYLKLERLKQEAKKAVFAEDSVPGEEGQGADETDEHASGHMDRSP